MTGRLETATRVETPEANWLLDDGMHRYLRMPKHPEPTPFVEKFMLTDLQWHPMRSWSISGGVLDIDTDPDTVHITGARVIGYVGRMVSP
jgi:hypothetical protein